MRGHPLLGSTDLIPIVEVVRGALTCEATMERTMRLMAAVGKLAAARRARRPGFVGDRLQHALWREAIDLVATGVCRCSHRRPGGAQRDRIADWRRWARWRTRTTSAWT
jgi:hypothetical protein